MTNKRTKKKVQKVSEVKKLKKGDSLPTIKAIENNVLKCIIGQDEAVRRIITAIYRSIYLKSIKSNILVIGRSGTGKTETLKQIARNLKIPYTVEDATKYTKEGYYGNDVTDMIENLLFAANFDLEKASHGMIIIDKIDKKAGHNQGDVVGVAVLNSLLKIIEGCEFGMIDGSTFDTSNLIIVFCGAFSGIERIKRRETKAKVIGFNTPTHIEPSTEILGCTKSDLVQYGLPEEFVGRIDTIVEMKALSKDDLIKILSSSKLSIFKKYQNELKKLGITITYPRKLFERIAEKAMKTSLGARELSNVVNYIFEEILYNVLSHPGEYQKCKLDIGIVDDNMMYKLS